MVCSLLPPGCAMLQSLECKHRFTNKTKKCVQHTWKVSSDILILRNSIFFFFRVLHSLSTTVVVFSHHSLSRFLFHMLCLTFLPSFLRNSCYFSRFPHSSFPSSLNNSNSTSLRLFPSFIYSQTLVSQEGVPDHLGNVSWAGRDWKRWGEVCVCGGGRGKKACGGSRW